MKMIRENRKIHYLNDCRINKITAESFSINKRNSYGMACRINNEDDDKRAFFSIQIERYLKRKTLHRFCSNAERDVIKEIISDYWNQIKKELSPDWPTDSKINTFYKCIIVFPYFVAEEEQVIPVDFNRKSVISINEKCSCGSDLPYIHCCGRTAELEDLDNVSF